MELVAEAQEELIDEAQSLPLHPPATMTHTRIWAMGSTRLTVRPLRMVRLTTCGLILAGMVDCGDWHGFVEADMDFLMVDDPSNPLAKAEIMLDK